MPILVRLKIPSGKGKEGVLFGTISFQAQLRGSNKKSSELHFEVPDRDQWYRLMRPGNSGKSGQTQWVRETLEVRGGRKLR